MSFVLAPAAPTTPEVPAFSSANDARSEPERSLTFGPTLSDARERLSSTQARRTGPVDHRSSVRGPVERSTRPERPDRPASDVDNDRPTRADSAEPGSERRVDAPSGEDTSAPASDTDDSSDETSDANAATAGALTVLANLLPSAKGTTGVDGSSIDLTIEGAIAPDSLGVIADSAMIADGVNVTDLDAMVATAMDPLATDVATMGRQAALTSLGQVSDADLGLADRFGDASAEEIAGPTVMAETDTRADPFGEVQAEELASETSLQGRTEQISADRGDTTEAVAEAVEDAATAASVTGPIADVDAVDRPAQQTAIGTVTRSDAPDSVVVLARDASAAPENVRAGPTATTPTSAALPEAEANLWEDVRSAFDRIRSTGDGQEVRMRLRPAELGELLVQVRTQGDHVSVRLVASSAGAQQTLMDDRVRLAAELARAGFDEGSVDIGQSNTGDTSQRGDTSGEESNDDRRSIGNVLSVDRLGSARETFERREPIRTDSGFRPGRTAQSTINLTL